jgi:O-antigen biosynthesis rhamnosyltransferase
MERHMALSCRFQRQWADVEALTCARAPLTRVAERDGIRVTEVGELGRFQSAPVSPLFPLYLRRARADVVVVHVPNPTAEIAWLLARPSGKLVVRYQSDVVRQKAAMRFYGPLQMKFLSKADIILAASGRYLETSQVLAPLRDRCRVIPLGILPGEFDNPDLDHVAALRERYGGGYVLFSGMHRYYKGLAYLVRAAAAVKAPVVIAGDGPERASCETLARQVGGRTIFTGALTQDELVAHLHGCDVFAFPSVARSEAFGISMLEAQACGKPVVATRIGTGVEYVNLDGKTGVNVPPRDPEALAEAINGLLDDPARARAMGAFARKRVEQEFHAERVARAEFEVYQELLG